MASQTPSVPASSASVIPCPDATKAFAAQSTLASFCAARAACPGFSGQRDATEWRREPHEWSAGISSGWALLTDGRVLELGPSGFVLRYIVDWGNARLLDDRLWVEQDGEVTLLELATGVTSRLGRVRLVTQSPSDLYVADDGRMRRLRRSDLAELGNVPWAPKPFEYFPTDVVVLRGGAGLLVNARSGGVLADLTTGTILRQHLRGAAVRPDGARLVACDLDTDMLVEVDTASGATTARFSVRGPTCAEDALTTPAAYSADPRYVFWGEQGSPRPPAGLPSVVIVVGDTAQGTVTRYEDRTVEWRGSDWASPGFDAARGRMCLGFAMPSVGWDVCNWELGAEGRAVRSPGPIPPPVGLPSGARLVARATSPSGDRTAVLYQRKLPGTAGELAIATATRGKLDRTTVVASGELPWSRLESGDRNQHGVGVRPVVLALFDERHAAILAASDGAPDAAYVDVETGSVQPLCTDAPQKLSDCLLADDGVAPTDQPYRPSPAHPRWIYTWETESLFDGTTGKTYSVKASDAEWQKATRIVPACP
ncbi:MAG: hypothetical protein IT373_19695 [Polyangiaceae bacterium]|nr:hypothetical protein [Polyangiaceae bacterium]